MGFCEQFFSEFSDLERVRSRELSRLDKLVKAVARGPYSSSLLETGELSRRSVSGALRALVERGALRPDRVVHSSVETEVGTVQVLVPLAGRDVLATEFSVEIELGASGPVFLARGEDSFFGRARWASTPGNETDPATTKLCAELDALRDLAFDLEWDVALSGGHVLELPWALQIVPLERKRTQILMTSGKIGLFRPEHGLSSFLEKVRLITDVLDRLGESGRTISTGLPIFPCLVADLA